MHSDFIACTNHCFFFPLSLIVLLQLDCCLCNNFQICVIEILNYEVQLVVPNLGSEILYVVLHLSLILYVTLYKVKNTVDY